MKRLALITLLLGVTITSCRKARIKASGDVTTEMRTVSTFDGVDVQDAIEVDIIQSPTQSVEVTTNSNLHEYIVTSIQSGKLVIRLKNNVHIKNDPTIKVKVYINDLTSLKASGASKVEVLGSFITNSIDFELSGASRLYGNYVLNTSKLNASGASNINISGQINYFDTDLSGATVFKGFNMVVDNLDIEMSGASNASVTVNGIINIKASGASTLYYEGNGTINEINMSGASQVKKN